MWGTRHHDRCNHDRDSRREGASGKRGGVMFTVGSLFSGIGGIDLAAHWAGFTTSWFVEREPFCQKVLAKHWTDVPIHNDVFECHDLPHVSLVVGGFPCQPFSVAGKRQGANDERYLLPEMLRIVSEVKPYAVLFENVPGFPQLNDGAEFKYLLGALAEMGFDAEWGHIRASDIGAPHQRERWFLVAYAAYTSNTSAFDKKRRQPSQLGGSDSRSGSGDVVNASSTGREKRNVTAFANRSRHASRRLNETRANRLHQSRMGRNHDGIPGGMDFLGFPARPGENQYSYEPPRVTVGKVQDRAARLKSLGNAVVPYQVYPILASIHEWLTGLAESEAA